MAAICTVELKASITDSDGVASLVNKMMRFATASRIERGDYRTYSITAAAFQALTVPTSAKGVFIFLPATAETVTLKGVTGDTGVALSPASNPLGLTAFIPLGDTPSIGLTNGGAATEVIGCLFV